MGGGGDDKERGGRKKKKTKNRLKAKYHPDQVSEWDNSHKKQQILHTHPSMLPTSPNTGITY